MKVSQNYTIRLGLLLTICTNQISKARTIVECPNLPITPYPPVQTSNPTITVNSETVQAIGQPVYPVQSTSAYQTTCSQNIRTPCKIVCRQNSSVDSGNLQPIYPWQTSCSPPVYSTNLCNAMCSQSPINPCQIICGQDPCPNIPSPPTTTLSPKVPPTNLPPPNIIMCPPGTILIAESCHVVYCPLGSVMRNNRCVVIKCPEGSIWTGNRCSVPEPNVHNLTFNNTITTYINQTTPDIVFNNTKSIVISLPITIHREYSDDDYENYIEETKEEPTSRTTQNCCEVMTPRICEERNSRWHCYSRRSRRCGDFCIAPIIYLKPSRVYANSTYVVLPPIQTECNSFGTCGIMTGGHDCSGCAVNNMSRCSYYCYRYRCPSQQCDFFDHREYCSNNESDMFGCREVDGCYDDWCSNN